MFALAIAVLTPPASALATAPAQGQYQTPQVTAGGSGNDRGGADGTQSAVPAASSSDGSGNVALPILLAGVVVIGGAGALILYRRRRGDASPPE